MAISAINSQLEHEFLNAELYLKHIYLTKKDKENIYDSIFLIILKI